MIKELKRSIINYQFLIVCIISIILFSISSYNAVWRSALNASSATDLTSEGVKWILQSSGNKYNIWNQSFKIMGIIYPILLSSVYVYSYVEEYKNGFRLLMISREGKKKYCIQKILAIAIGCGLLLFIPEMIYDIGISIFSNNAIILKPFDFPVYGLYSGLYRHNPELYILLSLAMHFCLGMAVGVFCIGISFITENRVATYIVPFLTILIYEIVVTFITKSPLLTVSSAYKFMFTEGYHLIFFGIVLSLLIMTGIVCIVFKERKIDING